MMKAKLFFIALFLAAPLFADQEQVPLRRVYYMPDNTVRIVIGIRKPGATDNQILDEVVAGNPELAGLPIPFDLKTPQEMPSRAERRRWRWRLVNGVREVFIDVTVIVPGVMAGSSR